MGIKSNYFLQTPVYEIWCDLIEIHAMVFEYDVLQAGYAFKEVVCQREHVCSSYDKCEDQVELRMIYGYLDGIFTIEKKNQNSKELIAEHSIDVYELASLKEYFAKEQLFEEILKWKERIRSQSIF